MLSNPMRGYKRRTRRRRASYKKTNHLYKDSYYSSKSRWMGENHKKRYAVIVPGAAVCVLVCLVVFFAIWKGNNGGHSGTDSTDVVTPAAVTASSPGGTADPASQTAVPDGKNEVKQRKKAVALTFDDGPSTAYTMKILDLLEKYDAHATFFVVGNRVSAGADILKKEIAQGCEIGNHSWNHPNLGKMKIKQVNKNLEKTNRLVKKLTGYRIKLVRPPFGSISNAMRKKLKYPMILWNVDTLDWKSKNPKAVLKQVKKQVRDGSIILVHDIHGSTAEAMKTVLPWLIEHDYDILTVSELMERNGIKMKAGKAYGSAR